MINSLYIKNFRCFDEHFLPFRHHTIIVGKNNAGKSTIIEALRLISIITRKYKALNFKEVPDWLDSISIRKMGVSPSLEGLEINFSTISHRYGDPPSIIIAEFKNKSKIEIYLSPHKKIHAVLIDSHGNIINSKAKSRLLDLPYVSILPQIGPLSQEENMLTPKYVLEKMDTHLSSLHFRNQIHYNPQYFNEFKKKSESSWQGLELSQLEGIKEFYVDSCLTLPIREEDFSAEIGNMGHGLQMWLQIMWFLTMANNADTLILDEPDVYMHADLQRKLIRLLKSGDQQIILTTHSIEIMAEAGAQCILEIDRRRKKSDFVDSIPALQQVIDFMGGVHIINLPRLLTAKRFILVEGNDIDLLKKFQDKLFPKSNFPIDQIPNMSIGGWGGWKSAINSTKLLKNAIGEKIITYCLFDSDYHLNAEIEDRQKEAVNIGVELHIWKYKELENYLLVPEVILRYINARISNSSIVQPTVQSIKNKFFEIAEDLKQDIIDKYADEYKSRNKNWNLSTANKHARNLVKTAWETPKGILSIVPGKQMLSTLSKWSQDEFKVSLSSLGIVQEMYPEEINNEIQNILSCIEKGIGFNMSSSPAPLPPPEGKKSKIQKKS